MSIAAQESLAAAQESLARRGYVVYPGLYGEEFVQAARAGILSLHEALGRPSLCQEGWNQQAVEGSGITSSGLQMGSVLADFAPTVVENFLHPEVRDLFRSCLGEDFEVDVIGGCLSDESRARKPWHHHCGGPDEERRDPDFTPVGRPAQRLNLLVYLDDVGPGQGQLLVHSRRRTWHAVWEEDAIEQHGDVREDWPGQQVLSWTAGTAVILDERTWHAVWRQEKPGLRMFVGGYFRDARLPPPQNADPRAAAMAPAMR